MSFTLFLVPERKVAIVGWGNSMCVHFYLFVHENRTAFFSCLFAVLFNEHIFVSFFGWAHENNSCCGNEIRKYVKACACVCVCLYVQDTLHSHGNVKWSNFFLHKMTTMVEIKRQRNREESIWWFWHWYWNSAHPWDTCGWWFEIAIELLYNPIEWKEIETIVCSITFWMSS